MNTVQLPDLGAEITSLIRRARETGEPVEIEDRGVVVARVVPVVPDDVLVDDLATFWSDLDDLATEINAAWPRGISAADAVTDIRREL